MPIHILKLHLHRSQKASWHYVVDCRIYFLLLSHNAHCTNTRQKAAKIECTWSSRAGQKIVCRRNQMRAKCEKNYYIFAMKMKRIFSFVHSAHTRARSSEWLCHQSFAIKMEANEGGEREVGNYCTHMSRLKLKNGKERRKKMWGETTQMCNVNTN